MRPVELLEQTVLCTAPLIMAAGHSRYFLIMTLLQNRDSRRGPGPRLSPVLFCLDSEYAANAIQGTSQVHKNAVLIEKGDFVF